MGLNEVKIEHLKVKIELRFFLTHTYTIPPVKCQPMATLCTITMTLLTNQEADVLTQLSSESPAPGKHSRPVKANQLLYIISDHDVYLDPHLRCVCLPTGDPFLSTECFQLHEEFNVGSIGKVVLI